MDSDATDQMIQAKGDGLTPWTLSLGLIGALTLVIGVAFHADVWKAVGIWYNYPAYSHCFLILPISGWLIWERRAELASETPTPEPRALALSIAPLLLWLVGYYSTTVEFRQVAVVGFLQIALLGILGWRVYRLILFPAIFLFFLIPTGEYLIPTLQRLTSDFTDWGLTFFGVVHYRDGTAFELVNGRYSVAEACAGLRFLTATFTLGTLFCYLTFRIWWKSALFLAACIVFPIAANGVRVLATVMVANYTNNRVAAGMDHIVYGWGFAVVIMLLLLYVGSLFRDPDAQPRAPALPQRAPEPLIGKSIMVVVALAALTGIGPAIAAMRSDVGQPPELSTLIGPLEAQGWMVTPDTGAWRALPNKPSAQFAGVLSGPAIEDASVELMVNDYINAARDGSLISMKSNLWSSEIWSEVSSRDVTVDLGNAPATFHEYQISSALGERLIWSCYWINGRTTTSPLMVKLLQLKSAITAHDEAAIIVLATPIEGSVSDTRKKLATVLASTGGLVLQRLAQRSPHH
jgi:exosortase A